jgi:hypothetical protein
VRAIDLRLTIAQVKEGSDPRTQLEVALLKASRPGTDASTEALLMRIERLERGAPPPAAAGPDEPRVTRAPTRPHAPDEPAPAAAPVAAAVADPPAPAPAPAPATATAPPPLELQKLWPAVLERVYEGEGGEMLAALLADARPSRRGGRSCSHTRRGIVQQAQDRGPRERPAARLRAELTSGARMVRIELSEDVPAAGMRRR